MRNFFKIMGVIIGATFLFAPNPVPGPKSFDYGKWLLHDAYECR